MFYVLCSQTRFSCIFSLYISFSFLFGAFAVVFCYSFLIAVPFCCARGLCIVSVWQIFCVYICLLHPPFTLRFVLCFSRSFIRLSVVAVTVVEAVFSRNIMVRIFQHIWNAAIALHSRELVCVWVCERECLGCLERLLQTSAESSVLFDRKLYLTRFECIAETAPTKIMKNWSPGNGRRRRRHRMAYVDER